MLPLLLSLHHHRLVLILFLVLCFYALSQEGMNEDGTGGGGRHRHKRVDVFGKKGKGRHEDFLDAHAAKEEGRGAQRIVEALKSHNGTIDTILLGDSILSHIQLNETVWKNFHRKYNVMNLGSPRDRIEHMHFRIEHCKDLYNAKFIIILAGNNNIDLHETEKVVFEGLVGMVEAIFKNFNPLIRILMVGFLPRYKMYQDQNQLNAKVIKINNMLNDKYQNSSNVHYLDMYDKFLFKTSKVINRELFMPDNVHPSYLGYERMIEVWKPYLEGKVLPGQPPPLYNLTLTPSSRDKPTSVVSKNASVMLAEVV